MKIKVILFVSILLAGCNINNSNIDNRDNNSSTGIFEENKHTYTSLDWLKNQDNTIQDLWSYLGKNMFLTIPNNNQIKTERQRYLNSKTYLQRITYKAEPYLYWIVEQLEERNLPLEIALLPIVESAFDSHATSSAKAAGLWQIVPTTGLYYGLKLDYWYDGRRDVAASTNAALNMLQRLNKMFDGDWLLTMAAYNSGEGRVLNAIKENKAKGKPTDFWSLPLPQETVAYVPKVLALADIIRHQQKYGVRLPQSNPKRALDNIDIGEQIELIKASQLTGIPLEKLYALNAGYKHGVTPPGGPHNIMIPKSYTKLLKTEVSKLHKNLITRTPHIVQKNESLNAIAKKYHTHVEAIRQANNLYGEPAIGQELIIPIYNADVTTSFATANLVAEKLANSYRSQKGQYQVISGDTLSGIANKLKVNVNDLKVWNKLSNAHALKIGQKLHYESNGSNTKKVTYKVSRGDTMTSISKKHNVDINDVIRWNNALPNVHQLSLGDIITLYVHR